MNFKYMKKAILLFIIIILNILSGCSEKIETQNNEVNYQENDGITSLEENDSSLTADENENCEINIENECIGSSFVSCVDQPKINLDKKTISFSAKNLMDEGITLISFSNYSTEESWPCKTQIKIKDVKIVMEDDELVDINKRPSIGKNQTFQVLMEFSDSNIKYVNEEFELSYSYSHTEGSFSDYFKITAK
jgi:hypothetical protein